ncbi:MAG: NAD(P)-dependent oxidoreductase, partial [Candidatus Aenigmarchaeota archaeon]|nr:NAD(P)-dependent oxidoreductase [Candidatus Aenigmarchaeota archaeon]
MPVKRILVTGSSGTIGTRLCEKLLEAGYSVTGVDIKRNKWREGVDRVTVIGDLRDTKTFERLPKDADMVIHLAANARVYDLTLNPGMSLDNISMLFNVLEFCRAAGIK